MKTEGGPRNLSNRCRFGLKFQFGREKIAIGRLKNWVSTFIENISERRLLKFLIGAV